MDPAENAIEENRCLRRTIRDLVALSTLPAVWIGLGLNGIARSLADVLLNTLSLDLIYIRLAGLDSEGIIEVLRSKHGSDAAPVEVMRAALAPLLLADQSGTPITIPDPFGSGTLHMAVTRFGVGEDDGILVTGSSRAGFPNEQDRLLLGVGANQTAIVVQRLRAEAALAEARSRLEAALVAGAIATWTWDIPENRLIGDPSLARLFNLTPADAEDALLDRFVQSIHPEDWPRLRAALDHSIQSGEDYEADYRIMQAFGPRRWVTARGRVERDSAGQPVRMTGVIVDITERKRLEDELRETDRRKDEFLATLAHELRNPLAPIRTGLELMKLSVDDPATLEETRMMMERQTHQLITLVDDLLDVSRITLGKLELRRCPVKLSDVIQSAVEASKPFIAEADHELLVVASDRPVHLNADPHRLAQVISNLLNNAAKYTPNGGRIRLSAERQAGDVIISVEDNGIGIPAKMLDHIFEMFAQIDHTAEKFYSGLGIGLTLVKSLVEMHEGQINVESEGRDQGCKFSVRLPVLEKEPEETTQPKEVALANHKHRVLIIDDNQAAAHMLSLVVKMLGNDVQTANDGKEGVDLAAEFRPDVVLMDIGMPRMNGYEAARHIRQQSWGQEMILVALTGWGQEEDRKRTKDAGFNHHLTKPAEPSDLQELFAALEKGS